MGIEAALLAMGASTGIASTVASVAGGLSALSGISSIIGGFQAKNESKNQAALAIAQSETAAREQVRLSAKEAAAESDIADDTRRRQKLAFMASGVSLQGSPLLVMEETRRKGLENVDEIMRAGAASSAARLSEGRIAATQAKSSGRKAFMSGLQNAAGSFAQMAGK